MDLTKLYNLESRFLDMLTVSVQSTSIRMPTSAKQPELPWMQRYRIEPTKSLAEESRVFAQSLCN